MMQAEIIQRSKFSRFHVLLLSLFTLSLFPYVLPQYRFIPSISLETFGIGLVIIFISTLFILKTKTINKSLIFFVLAVLMINTFSQLVSPFEPTHQFPKIFLFGIAFAFITQYFITVQPIIEKTYLSHVILSSILIVYGTYIYITGDIEDGDPNHEAWATIGRYWGFRYTQSTRNDDIFYIIPSFLFLFSWSMYSSGIKKYASFILMLVYSTIIFLSFSRGHILSAFLTLFFGIFLKYRYINFIERGYSDSSVLILFKMFITIILILLLTISGLFVVSIFVPEFNLLLNLAVKIISIYDPSAQYELLNMRSSNDARLNIIKIAFDLILKYPLGVGAENFQYASIFEGHGRYWGENTYLEYIVGFGVIGGILLTAFMLYPVFQLYFYCRKEITFTTFTLFLIATYIALAGLFNVLVGNLYFYLLYALIYSYIISKKINHRKGVNL